MGSAKRHIAGSLLGLHKTYEGVDIPRIASCLTGKRRSVMAADGVAGTETCYEEVKERVETARELKVSKCA